jgi:glycosyltransferase involved in cell wall biosynthesis
MDFAKIDVIIPSYNRTVTLDFAISSILIQGDLIAKIIVIDDGSNDDVIEFIKKTVSSRPKVQVIFSEHTGNPGLLRSIALGESNAEFVAFLDSDDFWFPGKAKIQLNEFKNQKVSLVCSNAIIYENEIAVSRYFHKKYDEITTKTLLKNNFIINSSVILRATALKLIDGYVSDFHVRGMEDYATWLRVSRIGQISYINKCLIGYTRSPDSFGEQMGQSKLPYLISEFNEWKSKLSLKEI